MNPTVDCRGAQRVCLAAVVEAAWARVTDAVALLAAIDAGALFAEPPADPAARVRHTAGVSLLSVLQRELEAAQAHLDAALPGRRARSTAMREHTYK
ncbi:hypothetical protein [Phenylobacterium sp.]|jgi:hypothetical protein|uniref:hypothetical protein n=1 Tax=Phenylobacterium sp. TaxID=1871053 RepID=UPI002F41807E